MNYDPERPYASFVLHGGDEIDIVIDARDESGIERAWDEARRTKGVQALQVSEIVVLWAPSARDSAFIARTFPGADFNSVLPRPEPDGWEAAISEAREIIAMHDERTEQPAIREVEAASGKLLLPILAGPSASRGVAMMEFGLPKVPFIPGKIDVLFALTGMTPMGKIGMEWMMRGMYEKFGEPDLEDVLRVACENLKVGLAGGGFETDDGDVVIQMQREGDMLAGSALVLPDFHERLSEMVRAERLLVGIPCPDQLYVTDADSAAARTVRESTLETEYRDGFLGPTVLLVESTGITIVEDREI